jgi:hypothetical protein
MRQLRPRYAQMNFNNVFIMKMSRRHFILVYPIHQIIIFSISVAVSPTSSILHVLHNPCPNIPQLDATSVPILHSTPRILSIYVLHQYSPLTISGTWGIVLMVLAIVFALTSIVSFCPLYAPFGINTCSTKK